MTVFGVLRKNRYIVKKIEGEYATLADAETGEELFIALALLSLGVNVNSRLKYKDFDFLKSKLQKERTKRIDIISAVLSFLRW